MLVAVLIGNAIEAAADLGGMLQPSTCSHRCRSPRSWSGIALTILFLQISGSYGLALLRRRRAPIALDAEISE